jgi:LysR family nitrogen assimilation transcriptional regulator
MAEALPNISLHIVEAMSGTLDEWIQSGRLDVALLYDHKAFEHTVRSTFGRPGSTTGSAC